jgi:hypothetical protein
MSYALSALFAAFCLNVCAAFDVDSFLLLAMPLSRKYFLPGIGLGQGRLQPDRRSYAVEGNNVLSSRLCFLSQYSSLAFLS